jgi:hypothetical protein
MPSVKRWHGFKSSKDFNNVFKCNIVSPRGLDWLGQLALKHRLTHTWWIQPTRTLLVLLRNWEHCEVCLRHNTTVGIVGPWMTSSGTFIELEWACKNPARRYNTESLWGGFYSTTLHRLREPPASFYTQIWSASFGFWLELEIWHIFKSTRCWNHSKRWLYTQLGID